MSLLVAFWMMGLSNVEMDRATPNSVSIWVFCTSGSQTAGGRGVSNSLTSWLIPPEKRMILSFITSLGLKFSLSRSGRWQREMVGWALSRAEVCVCCALKLDLKASPFKWGWDLLRNFWPLGSQIYFHKCPWRKFELLSGEEEVGIFKNSSSTKYRSLSNCMASLEGFPWLKGFI